MARDNKKATPATSSEIEARIKGMWKTKAGQEPDQEAVYLDRDLIDPGPFQYRRIFLASELKDLGDSIRDTGQHEPCMVRPYPEHEVRANPQLEGRFQLIFGEKRWRSTGPEYGDVKQLRCIIKTKLSDYEATRIAFDENYRRSDPAPIARARALQNLYDVSPGTHGGKVTWAEVGAMAGLTDRSARRLVELLQLPDEAQLKMEKLNLTEKHGRALLMFNHGTVAPDGQRPMTSEQRQLIVAIEEDELSGNQTLGLAESLRAGPRKTGPPASVGVSTGNVSPGTHSQNQDSVSGAGSGASSKTISRGINSSATSTTTASAAAPVDVVQQFIRPAGSYLAEAVRAIQEGKARDTDPEEVRAALKVIQEQHKLLTRLNQGREAKADE